MWTFTHTETTAAACAAVWVRYAEPATWSEWDHETEWVRLDGAFAVGATGRLKPRGGPAARFVVDELTPGRSFRNRTRLPLARLLFDHRIEPADSNPGTRITHEITVTGPLAPLFSRVIGRKAAASLPEAMRRLARLAERDEASQPGAEGPSATADVKADP